MTLFEVYFSGLAIILGFVTVAWILSVFLKNASIVDIFWGLGFVVVSTSYFFLTADFYAREIIAMLLVTVWGLRLSLHILIRNWGKPEDYRYREFRKRYGEKRYWWFSYFQVFLLQGFLMWLISAPLLAINFYTTDNQLNIIDFAGIVIWLIGFTFEAGGDMQLTRFKRNPENKGKLLTSGFWKFTRHPNYFGDAAVWWGFALISVAAGSNLPVLSAAIMTWLLLKVSGVALLEKSLKNIKPGFEEYVRSTNAFFPWFQKKSE